MAYGKGKSMEKDFLSLWSNETQAVALKRTNDYTQKWGLSLTEEDTELLLADRRDTLAEQRRVEFGEGILPKIIFTFCDSSYLYQDNYVDTIGRLQDIFYLFKNESLDEVSDDELLSYMKEQFEGPCEGSLEYLEDTSLEEFAREVREGSRSFIGCRDFVEKLDSDIDK